MADERPLGERILRRELDEALQTLRTRYAAGAFADREPQPEYDADRVAHLETLRTLDRVERAADDAWFVIAPPDFMQMGWDGEVLAHLAPGVWASARRYVALREVAAAAEAGVSG